MSEAQRLKMTGGHFIWIWADTSSTAEFFQPNSVQSGDDTKDQTKPNYNYEEFVQRKSFDQREPSSQQKYFQQQQAGGKRTQPNNTRYKAANGNSNRFHHIIGLRKPGDEINYDGSVAADQSFLRNEKLSAGRLSAGQPGAKQKRMTNQFSDSTIDPRSGESEYSLESDKTSGNLNIKNINSHEFNANYYDPYSRAQPDDGDFDESTNAETGNYDYDKTNPFRHEADATSASTTVRQSASDSKSKANSRNSSGARNGGNDNNADGMGSVPHPQLFDVDDGDDLSLDSYSDASNDLKAKRADNFPSAFNISSHVFFHHFKDFPVGLLALRHIKMNVDRVFVRSAIRLFASAWSRAEADDEPRVATSGGVGGSWSADNEYDYDEVNSNNRNKKLRNKPNVNNRQRGSRKYKRDAPEGPVDSISTLVNSSNKASNSNSNPKANLTYSQHVSGLHSHPSDDGNESNNDTLNHAKTNSKLTKSALDREATRDPTVGGSINLQKRQNGYWSTTLRNRGQDKAKGTPQYKGGCFGVPTRADIKRSEVFAR